MASIFDALKQMPKREPKKFFVTVEGKDYEVSLKKNTKLADEWESFKDAGGFDAITTVADLKAAFADPDAFVEGLVGGAGGSLSDERAVPGVPSVPALLFVSMGSGTTAGEQRYMAWNCAQNKLVH